MDEFLTEGLLQQFVGLLVRLVEGAGAFIIFIGSLIGFGMFLLATLWKHDPARFTSIRLRLGGFLALGLEFQLASDLLRTAVAPSFEQIGKLAAVATIRTILNFFLERELRRGRDTSGQRT